MIVGHFSDRVIRIIFRIYSDDSYKKIVSKQNFNKFIFGLNLKLGARVEKRGYSNNLDESGKFC